MGRAKKKDTSTARPLCIKTQEFRPHTIETCMKLYIASIKTIIEQKGKRGTDSTSVGREGRRHCMRTGITNGLGVEIIGDTGPHNASTSAREEGLP